MMTTARKEDGGTRKLDTHGLAGQGESSMHTCPRAFPNSALVWAGTPAFRTSIQRVTFARSACDSSRV